MQLYIDNELMDLADDSPIALTFQINNLAEVKNQQGNTSNQFKLPLTQRNRRILGFPDDVAFCGKAPYDNYPAKIVQDGLEIIPNGIAVLNGIEQDGAAITVLSGNVDFFDTLDAKIYDMGDAETTIGKQGLLKYFDHAYTVDNVVASQNKNEGWIWPVIDYGTITYPTDQPLKIDIRQMRPGFFLKTMVELIAKQAGYRINPDSFLLKQPLYQKLIVQFANDNFSHGTNYQNTTDDLGIEVTNAAKYVHTNDAYEEDMRLNTVINDSSNSFKSNAYVAKARVAFTASFTYSLTLAGKITLDDGGAKAHIYFEYYDVHGNPTKLDRITHTLDNDAQLVNSYAQITSFFQRGIAVKTFTNQKLSADVELLAGESLKVRYEVNHRAARDLYSEIQAGATFKIETKREEVLLGQTIQCERIFPDLSLKDLLKDTLQRFGIICQTDNAARTITFASFRDIVNNIPVARDWTRKCIDQGKAINFQLGSYAQENYLKQKEDDSIKPKGFGNTKITVNDKTLAATADLVESQFAPTLNRPYVNGTIAQILKVDRSTEEDAIDFSVSTQPRLLINDTLNLLDTGKQITFTDGTNERAVNSTIAIPYFAKDGAAESLDWEYLRKQYYPELEKILQQTKKVVRYFMLSPRDILELDLLIPVYLEQDSAYYYINKIDSWRKGQPVKVELVRL
ncbi:hypothetical protein DYU05_08890 [Mucilaginibacter terrenus]|uniref:Uncharacterized protein n=1 Tax=Mucilaginibacter terrenus TaxID=2482727 RepID=A0A3E2NXF1_9SPHI|nr:hypothetical protein [Mucilaginibacter terrenus]RFZ85695.1 hypothetical protein DYU05_08890 [Mucilaginibacter terrenus]